MAELRAGGAITLPRRCLGACDQAAVGHKILDPRDAGEIMHLVEQHHSHNLADAGDRWEPVEGLGVLRLGRLHDRQFDIAASRVIAVNQGEVDFPTLVHCRSGQPRGDPVAVGLVGALRPKLRQGVLPVGLLHGGQECRTCTRQMPAAPEQITSRPPLLGRDRGLESPPTAPPHGDFLGLERVVFGCAPLAGLHREGMPTPKGNAVASAAVGQPLAGQEAVDADDPIGPVGRDGLEQWLWARRPVPVHQNLPIPV